MSSIADRFYAEKEEAPTVRRPNFAATNIALACRVDAAAEHALNLLWAAHDGGSIAGAIAAISELRSLAEKVLR